jgi:hypothetical protein
MFRDGRIVFYFPPMTIAQYIRWPFCACATTINLHCKSLESLVKSRHDDLNSRCPLYPQKRTLIERIGMSVKCQKRTLPHYL